MYIIFCCVCRVHKTGYRLSAAAFTSTPTIDSAYRVTARAVCVADLPSSTGAYHNNAKASLHFSHFFFITIYYWKGGLCCTYTHHASTQPHRAQLGLAILFLFLFYCTICGVVRSFFTRVPSSSSFAMYRYICVFFFVQLYIYLQLRGACALVSRIDIACL